MTTTVDNERPQETVVLCDQTHRCKGPCLHKRPHFERTVACLAPCHLHGKCTPFPHVTVENERPLP